MPPAPSPIVPLDETQAHEAGLLGKTKTSDVVDAAVVTTALRQKATLLTSDPDDLERLATASGREVAVVAV
jgi:predicted nucleic acid-binding protein